MKVNFSSIDEYLATLHPEYDFLKENEMVERQYWGLPRKNAADYRRKVVGLAFLNAVERDRREGIEVVIG